MTSPIRPDAGEAAQRAAEAHLDACQAAEFGEENGEENVESPAVAPYCGCTTCDVRETLAAAWPIIVADCADLIARELPVLVNAGAYAAEKLLRAEAARMALPHTPTNGEGVHA